MAEGLPDAVREKIQSFPEYRMGVHRVDLVMRDGSLVKGVHVGAGGVVVRIEGKLERPLSEEEVMDALDRS